MSNVKSNIADLQLTDAFGGSYTYEHFKGKRVLLSFYRYTNCPQCNLRMRDLILKYPKYQEQGIELIAVFPMSKEAIHDCTEYGDIPFPLIADEKEKLFKAFGLQNNWRIFMVNLFCECMFFFTEFKWWQKISGWRTPEICAKPFDLIYDEAGNLVTSYKGEDIFDHMPLPELEGILVP